MIALFRIGLLALLLIPPAVYSGEPQHGEGYGDTRSGYADKPDLRRGRDIWLNKTYGGEKFFDRLASPEGVQIGPRRIHVPVAFENVINTPRDQRFQTWGTINDPNCKAAPGGGPDICPDPEATGVVGIRRFTSDDGRPIYGVACASCHVGFDPRRPPRDVNNPRWENIHPTIGNAYLKAGKLLSANLPATEPLRLMLGSWPDGTVDTTALFNDNIFNPSAITPIWELRGRPLFATGAHGSALRLGQGGEDDLGGERAAERVYTNIGACFTECVQQPMASGTAIDLQQCRASGCLPPERDLRDLVGFMQSVAAPHPAGQHSGRHSYLQGQRVFQENCASCHTTQGTGSKALSNDQITLFVEPEHPNYDPLNATHSCRALSSQWQQGHLWEDFSSPAYKQRAGSGGKGYRTMLLAGAWATPPFLHNQSVGLAATPGSGLAEKIRAFERAMWSLLSSERPPKVFRLPADLGPFPAGTPLTLVFSRDPLTNEVLCADSVENRGHVFGADLPNRDKAALIEWLKFQ